VHVAEEETVREDAVEALKDQLKEKDMEISDMRARYDSRQMLMMFINVFFGIIIFALGVVVGMILMRWA
jgi:hypothetical protein